jgi:uncharacterized protein (DUF1330 family)
MTDIFIDPSRAAFDLFKSLPRDVPINMLNFLKFKNEADYPADHPNAAMGWSGARAYQEYGKTSGPIFRRVGGRIIWRGRMEAMVIGPPTRHWDLAFIAYYPNSAAFLEMVTDPDYRLATINRQAAISNSRLIRFEPLDGDETSFG